MQNTIICRVSGKKFTGNRKFQGKVCMKPEDSPEDSGFALRITYSHHQDPYKFSGFLFPEIKLGKISFVLH